MSPMHKRSDFNLPRVHIIELNFSNKAVFIDPRISTKILI